MSVALRCDCNGCVVRGLKTTFTVHVPPGAKTASEQLSDSEKSEMFGPARPIVGESTVPPLFVTVNCFAGLDVLKLCAANVAEGGATCNDAAAVAVPLSDTACGLPEALSVNARAADLLPADWGANDTDAVHAVFGERLKIPSGQGVAPDGVIEKSAALGPVTVIDVIESGAVPMLESVTV